MALKGLVYATPDPDLRHDMDDLLGRDYRWIQRAIGVALTSQHATQMGAIAVKGGNVLGWGVNRFRNHPMVVEEWSDCSVHAEQSLIDSCDIYGSVVYVARVTVKGLPAMAKPCRECLRSLTDRGARRVLWTESANLVARMNLG